MKRIILMTALFLFTASSGVFAEDVYRYYFSSYYKTEEFKQDWPTAFKRLPTLDAAAAKKKAASDPEVQKVLKEDDNYYLGPYEDSYTEDGGRTWTAWEFGVKRLVMNSGMRIDAIFGVDPFSGKVTRLKRPIISIPSE